MNETAERSAFEAWAVDQWGDINRAPHNSWLGWQGRSAADATDAARYRWLRSNAVVMADFAFSVDEEVEAVVDAAIADAQSSEQKASHGAHRTDERD